MKLEEVLADAFVVERRLPCPSGFHRRFEVTSRAANDGRRLMLTCAQYGSPLPEDSLARQRDLLERMSRPPVAVLGAVSAGEFQPNYHWMTAPLPPWKTVHEALRERRRLPLEEVERLLQALAAGLAPAVQRGWPLFTLALHEILFDSASGGVLLLPPDMPLFGMTSAAPAAADPLQTIAFRPAALQPAQEQTPVSSRDYVRPLALLCCEMLGEELSGAASHNERFRPIAALSAQQNRVLRAVLAGAERHPFEHLEQFVVEFTGVGAATAAEPVERRPAPAPAVAAEAAPAAPPPMPSAPVSLESTLAAAGFQPLEELRQTGPCRVWSAEHATHGACVVSAVDLSMEVADTARRLQALMTTLGQSDAAHFILPCDVRSAGPWLLVARVRPARTLLDALRSVRAFDKPTAARILASIHAAYEMLWGLCGRRIVAASTDQFWLAPGAGLDFQGAEWRLDAAQILLDHEFQPQAAVRPIEHFARLALHLLGHDGGGLASATVHRFTPLAELSPGTNEILRTALDPTRTGDLSLNQFIARIIAALAGHTAIAEKKQGRPLKVAPAFEGREASARNRLRLMPDMEDAPVLALCAEQRIKLGRGSAQVDFVTQFQPRSPVNDSRTRAISRVNTEAYLNGSQILLQDLADASPSLIDARRIGKPEAVDLPLTLLLGGEYPVEFQSMRSGYGSSAPVVSGWPPPPPGRRSGGPRGACMLRPGIASGLNMQLGWVFTDIGLRVTGEQPATLILCSAQDPTCLARIHHYAGGFWIECASSKAGLRLDETELQPGELAPLEPGVVLSISSYRLLVREFVPASVE